MLDDNDLLDFASSRLAHGEAGDARRLLHKHGDVFRAQLVAARWIDGWRRRMKEDTGALVTGGPEMQEGIDYALREVVAHLRQGDFLPGGTLYDDEISGQNEP